ncbi:DUF3310 domain-containing protein [Loigolactobacillus bifermentans]|uniref:DUF3310 domain-containing protein n=1 Tax=Loigolactobacillus bifermentans TaxID=1607 RepID=UPI0009FB13F9|nr:DUF3310 domain-containing protein [Loigolactobacillus bifermentans]QGG59569.1 DUF3310 domain-containing protein [Loigolactobacillus bifermentans]
MSVFKIGDKVEAWIDDRWNSGKITDFDETAKAYYFEADDCGYIRWIGLRDLRKVEFGSLEQVNHPDRYNHGKIEVIDIIESTVVGYKDPFIGFNLGNVVKYVARAPFKGKLIQDLKKARWYLDRAIKQIEAKEEIKSMGDKADEAAKKV